MDRAFCIGEEAGIGGQVSSLGATNRFIRYLKRYVAGLSEDKYRVYYKTRCDIAHDGHLFIGDFRTLFLDSPLRNWRFLDYPSVPRAERQRWFRQNEQFGLCDFAVGADKTKTLKTPEGNVSNAEIMHTLSRFGMKKFAGAVMYVIQTVFEAPPNPPEGGKLENTNWQTKYPWMICEPDEKEGKFLLNEIMQAGNFGKYDERISHETPSIPLLRGKKVPQQLWHAIEKTKHNLRLLTHYPEEVLCEPFFRLYHYLWRRFSLWRY